MTAPPSNPVVPQPPAATACRSQATTEPVFGWPAVAVTAVVLGAQGVLVAWAPALTMAAQPAPSGAGLVVLVLVAATGLLFVLAPWLAGGRRCGRYDLALILAAALAARLVHLPAPPILDDDVWRYLWDGLVLTAGFDPFAHAPRALAEGRAGPPALHALAAAHAPLVARIVAPELSTIYPAGAQALFAFSVAAFGPLVSGFRVVTLLADVLAVALLLGALKQAGRPLPLVALYALNPLVILVTANAAHVDAVLAPLLVGAALVALRGQGAWAGLLFGAAVAVKLWPALFGAILLRALPAARWPLFLAVAGAVAGLGVLPLLISLAAPEAGLAAYATGWRANNGLFDGLAAGLGLLLAPVAAEAVARVCVTAALVALGFGLAVLPVTGAADLARRFALLGLGFVLLMPSPYPWYALPALAFGAVGPVWPALAVSIGLAPAYLSLPVWIGTAPAALAPFLLAAAGYGPSAAALLAALRARR